MKKGNMSGREKAERGRKKERSEWKEAHVVVFEWSRKWTSRL
jgi:hypothetical protein